MISLPTRADERETNPSSKSELGHSRIGGPVALTFVIAWHPSDPGRAGELAILPADAAMVILGRGASDSEPRMRFFRPLPGSLNPALPLSSPGLSRRQLEVRPGRDGVEVRSVGQCPMRINGVKSEAGIIRSGDTLTFGQELVLLCLLRPVCPAPLRFSAAPELSGFGFPDGFGILGESPAIWRLRDEISFAAKSGQHVLFIGESGTGKELAARAVHQRSSGGARPFVARNAATLPAGLIDAEVFGNVRNYPNPGMADRPGLIGEADGGFLFLDEIGELPAELQSHLLRVLDAGGEYHRLGESTTKRSSFRLLAATNRDPSELRHDLLARFALRIELPPLSERREDIPLLARHFLTRAAENGSELISRFLEGNGDGLTHPKIDAKLIDALLRRDYPGNARDLEAALWKAMAASEQDRIEYSEAALIPARTTRQGPAERGARPAKTPPTEQAVRDALQKERGNVARAAKALGLSSRYALYRMLLKLGIDAAPGDER